MLICFLLFINIDSLLHIRPTRPNFVSRHPYDLNDPNASDDGNEDEDERDGSFEDSVEEDEGDFVMNKSGLSLPGGAVDPYDERFYPGGEFDLDNDIYVPERQIFEHGKEKTIGMSSSYIRCIALL